MIHSLKPMYLLAGEPGGGRSTPDKEHEDKNDVNWGCEALSVYTHASGAKLQAT